MTTDQSMFGSNPNTAATTATSAAAGTQTQNDNPFATLLGGIKNEHGVQKFQSPEDLARGYLASQEFINTLKREKEEAERRAQEATRMAEERSSQLTSQQELQRVVDELTRKVNDPAATTASVKPEDIAELVSRTIAQREQANTAAQNQALVVNKLKEKFGEKAEEVYNAAAQQNGFSVSDLNSLAAKSPTAVLKLLGADGQTKPSTFAPGGSSVNTAALAPSENSMIGRNKKLQQIGTTTAELNEEASNARKMVEELHSQGLSIDDLTKPSTFFKLFK